MKWVLLWRDKTGLIGLFDVLDDEENARFALDEARRTLPLLEWSLTTPPCKRPRYWECMGSIAFMPLEKTEQLSS